MKTDDLRSWLIDKVSMYCNRAINEVDPDTNFSDYGLDSVYSLAIIGDIEALLGTSIDPTAIWDHATINKLIEFIQTEGKTIQEDKANHLTKELTDNVS